MTIPARYKHRRGWQTGKVIVNASDNGRPRVSLRIGQIYIQLDGSRAIRLCNEIIDAIEEVHDAER